MRKFILFLLVGYLMSGHQVLAKQSPPSEQIGSWKYSIIYDKMTDDPSYIITVGSSDDSGALKLVCNPATKSVNASQDYYFGTSEFAGFGTTDEKRETQYRVDEKPRVLQNWSFQNIKKLFYFSANSNAQRLSLVENLKGGKVVLAQLRKYDGGIISLEFDITGFDEAYEKLKKACHL